MLRVIPTLRIVLIRTVTHTHTHIRLKLIFRHTRAQHLILNCGSLFLGMSVVILSVPPNFSQPSQLNPQFFPRKDYYHLLTIQHFRSTLSSSLLLLLLLPIIHYHSYYYRLNSFSPAPIIIQQQ